MEETDLEVDLVFGLITTRVRPPLRLSLTASVYVRSVSDEVRMYVAFLVRRISRDDANLYHVLSLDK